MASVAIFAIAAVAIGAAYLLTPKNKTVKNELDSLQYKGANEGEDIATFWGTVRVPGQIIFAPEYEVITSEEEVGGKGGGGSSVETQSALGTFMVSFGRPRPGVGQLVKLYLNKKLYFDGSGDSELIQGAIDYTFYDGSQTEPDDTYETYVGSGNASAYMGECTLMVRRLDLRPFGNTIPSSIEAVISATATGIVAVERYPIGPSVYQLQHMDYSPATGLIYGGFAQIAPATTGRIATIDPVTGVTGIYLQAPTVTSLGPLKCLGVNNYYGTGELLMFQDQTQSPRKVRVRDAANSSIIYHTTSERAFEIYAETENYVFAYLSSGLKMFNKATWSKGSVAIKTGYNTYVNGAVRCGYNEFMCAITESATGNVHFAKLSKPGLDWIFGAVTIPSETIRTYCRSPIVDKYGNAWFIGQDTSPGSGVYRLFEISPDGVEVSHTDLTALGHGGLSGASGEPQMSYDADVHSVFSHLLGNTYVFSLSSKTLEIFHDGAAQAWTYYHRESGSVIGGEAARNGEAVFTRIKIRLVETDPLQIGEIITDLSGLCGIEGTNASSVTRELIGFVANDASSGRKALNQLLQLGLADVFEADWTVKFATLGGSPIGTLLEDDLGVGTVSGKVEPLVTTKTPGGVELPRKTVIHYLSASTYERATATATMYHGKGDKEETVTFTAVLDDAFAKQLAHILIQLAYGAVGHEFTTSRAYDHYHPGDEIYLPTKYGIRQVRILQKDTGNNGVIKWKAVESDPENLLSSAEGGATAPIMPGITAIETPKLKIMALPLMADSHYEGPSPYFGAYVYSGQLPVSQFYGAPDGQSFESFASKAQGVTIGQTTTLPDAGATADDWDDATELELTITAGTDFYGATDAALLSGANYAAYGAPGRWEIVQYGIVTVMGVTARKIERLLRGRKGTEWAMGLHVVGDEFIALTTTSLTRQYLDAVTIGGDYYYKVVAAGKQIASAVQSHVVIDDIVYVPYAPINLAVVDNATIPADKDLSWEWRTRIGGVLGGPNTLTDGCQGTMSDDDAGEIEILDDDLTTVLNTYAVTGELYTYTSAAIAADYSGTPIDIHWRVAQDASMAGVGVGTMSAIHTYTL